VRSMPRSTKYRTTSRRPGDVSICLHVSALALSYHPQLSESAATLADPLRLAASQSPKATALIAGDQHWSFAEWLDSCAAHAAGQANTGQAWCASGSSLQLANLACAASLQNRPFWPVDRSPRDNPPNSDLPAATALIISTSGSEGKPRAVLLSAAKLDAAAAASNQRLPLGPGCNH